MNKSTRNIKDFIPLFVLFGCVILFTILCQYYTDEWDITATMSYFMAGFFLIFGTVKLLKLSDFAQAYATYDIIAQRSHTYALLYPFLEIGLGIAYLTRFMPWYTNLATLILMSVSSIGVVRALYQQQEITCACLGTVFKIPMTWVTALEDIGMALMAAYMLFS